MAAADPPLSFLAAQRWRLRLAWEDAGRIAGGAQAAWRAGRGGDPDVGVAQLEAPAVAPEGGPTAIRVRVHNPTGAPAAVTVQVTGRAYDDATRRFIASWECELGAGAVDERWVSTRWRGDAVVAAVAPPMSMPAPAGDRRWTVEASVARHAGTPSSRLVVGGVFGR